MDGGPRRSRVRSPGDWVPRKKVDVASTSNLRAQQLGERAGVLRRIVLAREQGVLERHTPTGGLFVVPDVVQESVERVRLGGGDEPLSQLLGWGVQRHREGGLQSMRGEFGQRIGHTNRGDREVSTADADVAVQAAVRSQYFAEIQKRFAHSHHHDVRRASPEHVFHREHLIHDLVRRQIASESLTSRRAEGASHRTANLRAHAHRESSPSSSGIVLLLLQFIAILVQIIFYAVLGSTFSALTWNPNSLDDASTPELK